MRTTLQPQIAFDDVGQGEPALLFLPGWCVNRTVFGAVRAPIAEAIRVLTLDWRGHGESSSAGDYSVEDLVADAMAVIEQSGVSSVIPVAQAHAGWVAIELRRRLGPNRVPAIVVLSWMVLGPPPGFADALAGLGDPDRWEQVRDGLLARWTGGEDIPALRDHLDEMRAYGFDAWARAGREIARSFDAETTPLAALERLSPACPTLHLYAQPADDGFLRAQEAYVADHPWFSVRRLAGRSHFPTLEMPAAVAAALLEYAAAVGPLTAAR